MGLIIDRFQVSLKTSVNAFKCFRALVAEINGVLPLESKRRDLVEELIKQFHNNSQ